MPVSQEDVIAKLPHDRQEKIRARAWELLMQESAMIELPAGGLVALAIEEYRQGKTTNINDLTQELGIDLTDR